MSSKFFRRARLTLAVQCVGMALAAGLAYGWGLRIDRVRGDEMVPSLRHGDWVLTGPVVPSQGDVVRLSDPLDPHRRTLRRVLALDGQSIGFSGHQARVDGQALKHVLMEEQAGEMVLMENSAWLLAVELSSTTKSTEPTVVPPGHLFLVADHRDVALDSRWWGAVPTVDVLDTVLLRVGPRDVWRAFVFRPRQTVRPEIPLIPYQPPDDLALPR